MNNNEIGVIKIALPVPKYYSICQLNRKRCSADFKNYTVDKILGFCQSLEWLPKSNDFDNDSTHCQKFFGNGWRLLGCFCQKKFFLDKWLDAVGAVDKILGFCQLLGWLTKS